MQQVPCLCVILALLLLQHLLPPLFCCSQLWLASSWCAATEHLYYHKNFAALPHSTTLCPDHLRHAGLVALLDFVLKFGGSSSSSSKTPAVLGEQLIQQGRAW